MTSKKYRQSDALIQWAYFLEDVKPLHTSSCALFWRSVVLTPLKVLGPTVIALFFLTVFVAATLSLLGLGAWLPEVLRRPSGPPQPMPTETKWVLGLGFGCILAVVIGARLGLWAYLYSFCTPVEIEGGLVRKGSCPSCARQLVLVGSDRWNCLSCKGYFVPPVPPKG